MSSATHICLTPQVSVYPLIAKTNFHEALIWEMTLEMSGKWQLRYTNNQSQLGALDLTTTGAEHATGHRAEPMSAPPHPDRTFDRHPLGATDACGTEALIASNETPRKKMKATMTIDTKPSGGS